jgi:hypothetical protein
MFPPKTKCSDGEMARLFDNLILGDLNPPEREQDRHRFIEHSRACQYCRSALIEHAHEEVTVPELQNLAHERGLKVGTLAREIVDTTRRAILNCEAERVFALVGPPFVTEDFEKPANREAGCQALPDQVATAEPNVQGVRAIDNIESLVESSEVAEVTATKVNNASLREEEAEATP